MLIKSPFINNTKILYNYDNIYVLVKKKDINIPIEFYKEYIPIKIFNKISKELFLYQVSNLILENIIHKNDALLIHKKYLIRYNIFNYKLNEYNLIIPLLYKPFNDILYYLIEFNNLYTISNLYKINKINNLYSQNKSYLLNIINNLNNNTIWDNKDYYKISNIKEINIRKFEFNELFNNIKEYQEVLFCNMLINIESCHLVINNYNILKTMKEFINNNIYLIKYLLSYTWLILYSREYINIDNVTINNSYIFNINTASLLPRFPIFNNIKLNPYIPLLFGNNIFDYTNNFSGITINKNNIINYGISNLNQFKYRFNIFNII